MFLGREGSEVYKTYLLYNTLHLLLYFGNVCRDGDEVQNMYLLLLLRIFFSILLLLLLLLLFIWKKRDMKGLNGNCS